MFHGIVSVESMLQLPENSRADMERGRKRPRAAFADLTNTPPRSITSDVFTHLDVTPEAVTDTRLAVGRLGQPSPLQDGAATASIPVSLQRYSLCSRARVDACKTLPGCQVLQPPRRLFNDVGCTVSCCQCSWAASLQPTAKRLCRRETDEHQEHRLLSAMGQGFADEQQNFCRDCPTSSSNGQSETHFVLDPKTQPVPAVLGFATMFRNLDAESPSDRATVLTHLFIEPEYRERGVATTALKMLLVGCNTLFVDRPSYEMVRILKRLRFEHVGQGALEAGRSFQLFTRTATGDENRL